MFADRPEQLHPPWTMPHGDIASDCYWSILPSLLEPPEWSAESAGEMTEKVFGPAAPIQQRNYAVRGRSSDQGYMLCLLFSLPTL